MPNPYIVNAQPIEFQQVAPNTASQEQLKAMLLQQQAQQVAQAGQTPKQGNDAMALAMALRGNNAQPTWLDNLINPYMPTTQWDISKQYKTDMYSPQSLMIAQQNQGLPNGN